MKVSRFTPSLMQHEDLEAIFVQRHQLAEDIVERISDSVLTPSPHHTLLIGSRGIGKTHLVSLVYHRIRKQEALQNRLLIAWLREEEWGVTSFLDLLLRIFRALQENDGDFAKIQVKGGREGLIKRVESLYELSPDEAEQAGAELLKEIIGENSLLLLMENLDDIFSGLGKKGQKQLHAFLQENPGCMILATSQSLFDEVKKEKSLFYRFFHIDHLEDLTVEEAIQLLANIARVRGDRELESFIRQPRGRDRIQAVHHLAGGNHRVYVIFSEFLTRESLDELVEPFMRMLDDLTPYYQARMASLSPQQRKIVEFLCDRRHGVPVKEIAQRCFLTHQTTSSQLKDLREKGYVISDAIGRESFYEMRETLMRFCLEVKKQRGEPIQLFVDFLRIWYTKEELLQRLGVTNDDLQYQQRLKPLPSDAVLEREYILYALQAMDNEEDEDPRIAACLQEYENCFEKKDYVNALELAEKLVTIRGQAEDWFKRGLCLSNLQRYEEALVSCEKAIELAPNYAPVWVLRGKMLYYIERYEEAFASCDKAIELNPNYAPAWFNRGTMLYNIDYYQEALVSYEQAIELDPNYAPAWFNRGTMLYNIDYYQEALVSYEKAIELAPSYAEAWCNRGAMLYNLERYEDALVSYEKAIELAPSYAEAWCNRGAMLYNLERYEDALVSYEKAIELDPGYAEAWGRRGLVLSQLKRYEEGLVSYEKAIELDPSYAEAWRLRGLMLDELERYEEGLVSYEKAIELDPSYAEAWGRRGFVLEKLERYEESLVSYEKAIEFDPNYAALWFNQGWVLDNLERYEEALVSCDKAIELGFQDSSVFLNRAIAILGLNRWDEGIAALENAFQRFTLDDEADADDAKLITHILFNSSNNVEIWRSRIKTLIELYHKHQVISTLGQGLVKSVPTLMSEMVSDKAAQTWLEVWQELASDYPEFQIPLRLLNTAVRYKETKGNKRVLFSLPIEERKLLEPLLGIADTSAVK
ncbi:tetratricopeptide repeat protein [Coleofasciculus sp. F4-SAH-05]|uniref:tetratricopeptide repeat protein n=1 Tax=Coleofasciculus sp. F4-SAH-05 TaxID=3069525 RepID=UPI0032F4EF99